MFTNDNEASAIRFPSTANLYISSADRDAVRYPSSSSFVISKKENILAGFFTRFAMVEISLSWFLPNISSILNNNTFIVTVTGQGQHTVTIPDGFYTVASLMDYIVDDLNSNYGVGTFVLTGNPGTYSLECTTANFVINETPLAKKYLSFLVDVAPASSFKFYTPDILPSEYSQIDFVCSNLTYQQGLKDADTANISRDVIYRWVMGWDEEPSLDTLGYPILQGYTPFVTRRYLSFPKQIKWGRDQPLGQLQFEVYDAFGKILEYNPQSLINSRYEWGMQLLVSEL